MFNRIKEKLNQGENITAIQEASLSDGWIKSTRVLAIIEHACSYALFVFNTIKTNNDTELLFLDKTLAINSQFKINIDTKETRDLCLNIIIQDTRLVFEMPPSEKTNNFVAELYRLTELYGKKEINTDLPWLSKYTKKDSLFLDDMKTEEKDSDVAALQEQLLQTDLLRSPSVRKNTPVAARESVVRYQMTLKENDYTFKKQIRIFTGTWNVNDKLPTCSLNDWLAIDVVPPDVYAIGFQELDLSKEAYLFNDSPKEDEWLNAVLVSLHPKGKYHKKALIRLVGMMLIVFVEEHLDRNVRDVSTDTVGTGIMGKLGNKGAVAVRLDIHNTSICFVNAHLAAHVEEYERRNQDYHDICSRISFTKFVPPRSIKDHDQVYWIGDLNYRITELDSDKVKTLLDNNNYEGILLYDQLNQNIKARRVFQTYKEGTIQFKPTYKYDVGSDEWDSSEKQRAPAWCDRILWRGENITQIAYRSHHSLRISDHKPVSAVFNSEVRVIDAVRYRKTHEEVMKKLDKLENEFLPQVMVDTTEVIFEDVYFLEPQTRDLIVANTGQVPVQFEFIKKLEDTSYCKTWLNIEPYMGFIMPGEKCDITLEIYVDKRSACKLNTGKDDLYDILVLHLEGGKDIFITVTGNYIHSCFGCSLEALAKIPVPIREVPKEKVIELENKKETVLNDSGVYAMPKEIWFLVDHLYRHAMKQNHLFEQPGLHSELLQIRDWLDKGSFEQMPGSVHSVVEALLLILDASPEPVIPYSLHETCLNGCTSYTLCKQIMTQLPVERRNVFLYLCMFLQELLAHSDENNLHAKTVATIFGGIFIRDENQVGKIPGHSNVRSRAAQQVLDRKKASFVYHFLVNDQSDLIINYI